MFHPQVPCHQASCILSRTAYTWRLGRGISPLSRAKFRRYFINNQFYIRYWVLTRTQVFEGLRKGVEVEKIRYTAADIPAIKKAHNFAYVQKKNRVNVFNYMPGKTLIVSGFTKERVKRAAEYITNGILPLLTIVQNYFLFFLNRNKKEIINLPGTKLYILIINDNTRNQT